VIDLNTYLMFVGAAFILVIAPGPDMAYMLARTIAQGRAAGFLAAAGINAGAYVHVFTSVVGLTAILAASSVAFTALKWAGACYLVWIGYRALTRRSSALNVEGNTSVSLRKSAIFWQGFWSDVLNPKVAIFFLAFLPQFVDVTNQTFGVTRQLLLLGVTCNVVAICTNLVLVYFASAMTNRLRKSQRLVEWMHKAMGAVFIALGIRIASQRF
jgi:threonine/homoserine/homoserine lactone efflux protein